MEEVKTYKYKLNTEKSSGMGLKGDGPVFTLVKPVHELTLDQVKENFLLIQKEVIVFAGAKKDDPLTETLLKEIKSGVTNKLEMQTVQAEVGAKIKEIEDKMGETLKAKDKEIAQLKKDNAELTKANKDLVIEKEKLEKELKK
jgi:hypothetical protein